MSPAPARASTEPFLRRISPIVLAAPLVFAGTVACLRSSGDAAASADLAAAAAEPEQPPAWEALENATYQGISGHTITLAGGNWRGTPVVDGSPAAPSALVLRDLRVDGELDGDGVAETYVLVSFFGGGTGELVHLAAFALRDGEWQNVATLPLGDRVKVRGLALDSAALVLTSVEAGSDDAMCCPTRKLRRAFGWKEGALAEISREDQGEISVADLQGVDWVLERIDFTEDVPEGVRVTATFSADGVAGSAGCNQYRAPVTPSGPMELSFGPAIATRRACDEPQMEIESRYLEALGTAHQFTFLAGKLALSYRTSEETIGTLVFVRSRA